ncbi:DUF7935 family protein [Sediminibacterium soli]|uniref:DUF7935 family protein n=1 Tax=Sediminibacterium soli TaxID=2698829 RepID=UPI00137AA3E9|nr:hypothetical protein [Sediminibacterium soli]NCI46352.1 hypothetical protein [Sediminibacterium soli]
MDSTTLLTIVIGVAVVGGLYYVLTNKSAGKTEPVLPAAPKSTALQLQAYERLALLADRMAIPGLISRTAAEGLTAREMQFLLTKNLRDEFDYNITQQIYVSAEVWNAVKSLKEKNLLLINQVAATLAPQAQGMDLNRALLDFLVTDKQANLPELVSQAISFEAKKLL